MDIDLERLQADLTDLRAFCVAQRVFMTALAESLPLDSFRALPSALRKETEFAQAALLNTQATELMLERVRERCAEQERLLAESVSRLQSWLEQPRG